MNSGIELTIAGRERLRLSERDFLAEGGEARLYAQGDWVYKLYLDPTRMIPAAKWQELAVLDRPNIIRPQDCLLDATGQPVGFRMRRVRQAVALACLFTNTFRQHHGLTAGSTLTLVQAMQAAVQFIHRHGCLLVDGNEMNYLVSEAGFIEPYLIDVDSYQTPSFPATALLPAIRDWHASTFSTLTDWFSFAIVTCQLFLGIHPYRGHHPAFAPNDLRGRMQANVSIFNPAVQLPPMVRSFDDLPPAYRHWFHNLFEQGHREPPPPVTGPWQPLAPLPAAPDSGQLSCLPLLQGDAAIRQVYAWQGRLLVLTRRTLYLEQAHYPLPVPDVEVIFTPKRNEPLLAHSEQGRLVLNRADGGTAIPCLLPADRLLRVANTLYALHQDKLTEVRLTELGDRCLVSPGRVWRLLPQATRLLRNLLYENVLGRAHLLIPFQPGACQRLPVPELDGYRLVDGVWEPRLAVLIAYRNGQYDRFWLHLDPACSRYQLRKEADLAVPMLNVIRLANDLTVSLHGTLELRHGDDPATATVRILTDVTAVAALTLASDGQRVLGFTGNRLYQLTLQP